MDSASFQADDCDLAVETAISEAAGSDSTLPRVRAGPAHDHNNIAVDTVHLVGLRRQLDVGHPELEDMLHPRIHVLHRQLLLYSETQQ